MRGPGPAPPERRRRLSDTLLELFRRGRPADPDGTLLLETPDGEALTYGDAERRSAQLVHVLRAAGVRPGDRVVVQVAKSPTAVLLYLACLRAGAVFVPLNPAYTAAEVDALVADAEPVLVVDDATLASLVTAAVDQPVTVDDAPVGPDDVAAMLYTSGTTGRPKGALLRHRNLASNAGVLHRVWGFRPDDVLLHALPVFHAHGLFVALHCVLANGTGMVFLPRFDVEDVLRALPRCTVYMGVPTHYARLLDDPRLASSAAGVRLFVSGSAPLSAATHESFRARTGHVILERYGMTETVMLTSNPLEGERRPGTVGLPLPGTDIRVDGWFRTGDLGRFDADGYLRIVGRAKDLVITGGLNVHPSEVEAVLDAQPGVRESAVIGVPDADFGEAVVAVVVPAPGATVEPEALRSAARDRLAAFKVPKRVELVDELPRNAMGKVEKAVLRARFGGTT